MSQSYPQYSFSNFPENVDNFQYMQDLTSSEISLMKEYKRLVDTGNITLAQQILKDNPNLTSKIFNSEKYNKLRDAILTVQKTFNDNVQGYIDLKQKEIEVYIDGKKVDIKNFTDEAIAEMLGKKNYFIKYVDSKENEVQKLVQEFDSNATRYYQSWTASDNQIEFNIYSGDVSGIPIEAKLNIAEENIDVFIEGELMKPYTDYNIKNNGNYDTIVLTSSASLGVLVVAKWYKNVGKLYFTHALSHKIGGQDELKDLDSKQLNKESRNQLIKVSEVQPEDGIWFKIIE